MVSKVQCGKETEDSKKRIWDILGEGNELTALEHLYEYLYRLFASMEMHEKKEEYKKKENFNANLTRKRMEMRKTLKTLSGLAKWTRM